MRIHPPSGIALAIAAGLAALSLAACGGGDSGGGDSGGGSVPDEAKAFCDELAAGTAPFDIFQSMRADYPDQPDWAAAAKEWAKQGCPDQLATNEQLRNIISNTGGDPDS